MGILLMEKGDNRMPKDEKEEDKIIDKAEDIKESSNQSRGWIDWKLFNKSRTPLVIAIVVIGLLLIGAIAAAISVAVTNNNNETQPNEVTFYSRQYQPRVRRVFVQNTTQVDTSDTTITSGVIKSVSGSSFVIAGDGNQFTVNTTGDTTYNTTDKKVSVNDSVMVVGTNSNSTITATDVRVVNF
jgi:hypothetical protein